MPSLKACYHRAAAYPLYFGLWVVWFLMQYLLYAKHGIRVVFDSQRYLRQADLLENGDYMSLKISYIIYTSLLALSNFLGSLGWMVLLQITVSGLSMMAMYKASLKLSKSQLVAALTIVLLIIWPDYQFWNMYIHTESLFVSITCLVFWRLVTANKTSHYLQLVVLLLLVMLLRPNGFMVVIATLVYLSVGFCEYRKYSLWKAGILLLSLFIVVVLAAAHFFLKDISSDHSFTKFLISGEIIQGYEPLRIKNDRIIELQGTPLRQTLDLVLNETGFFFKVSLMRLVYYWAQVRPYYSEWHNFAIVILMYPLYLLGMKALVTERVDVKVAGFIISLVFQFSAMVVVSAVDWDNRFFLPLLPFMFLLGVLGFKGIFFKTEAKPINVS